tara:strand:- start:340 stop:1308 length:969 start_codon:yes stop_codon:yes gene_type:complete
MPYKIEKNKNGSFSVVNKDSGRKLSKGTTEEKAKKQIKAVYMNGGKMKPEHKIRQLVSLLKDRHVKNPLHRKIVDFSKEILKAEEMRGAGFWDDLWGGIKDVLAFPSQIINEIPFVKEGIEAIFPEAAPILEFAPAIGKFIYGDDTNVWLSDMLSEIPVVGDIRQDKSYKTSNDLGRTNWFTGNKSDQQLIDEANNNIMGENGRYTERLSDTLENIEQITPQQSDTPYEPYAVPTYSPIRYDNKGNVIPVDSALRFPMIYNYEDTDQPKNLKDFLLSNAVAGKNFSLREFGNVVENQKPYAFLDFPLNGGSIRPIDYTKYCY